MSAKRVEGSGGISLFRIMGIQINLDYSWFIIFALILWSLSAGYFPRSYPGRTTQHYWIAGSIASFFFFLSIIIHELAHSFMAIRAGIKIEEVRLFIFGGVSRISEEGRSPLEELKIALVGPLSSFALAFVFWVFKFLFSDGRETLTVAILGYLAWINLALGVFNLIPGFPLDGGRVLRAVWWWRTGSLTQSTKVTSGVGKWFAVVLIFLGAIEIFTGALVSGLWLILIGMFLREIAEGGYREVIMRQALKGVLIREVMVDEVVSVPPDMPLSELASRYFLRYGYNGFPVKDNGGVLGVVLLKNLRNVPEEERADTSVRQVMIPMSHDIRIRPEESLADALRKMNEKETNHLVVMKEDRMEGLITKAGLKRFIEIKNILEK